MRISEFQKEIADTFRTRDAERGAMGTFAWYVEEVGELATALRRERPGSAPLAAEFADCLAWLASLATLAEVDLETAAADKYAGGCPRCGAKPCACPAEE